MSAKKRIFVYDDRRFKDPDPSLTPERGAVIRDIEAETGVTRRTIYRALGRAG